MVIINEFKCFVQCMIKWAKNSFRVVSYEEYWRRRSICKECALFSNRCPVCGCWLWAYCRLSTATCKNWYEFAHKLDEREIKPTAEG